MSEPADAPITKSTAMPALSLGVFVALVVGLFFAGRDLGKWKAEQEAGHDALIARLDRFDSRFDFYTGKEGANTLEIETSKEEMDALKLWLTEELGKQPR